SAIDSPSVPPAARGRRKPAAADAPSHPKPARKQQRKNPSPETTDTSHPSVIPPRHVWTVRDLLTGVRQQLERDHRDLWLEGEISNCRLAPSGHLYFTLKDGDAQLSVVLFRSQALLLRFRPQDGMAVVARGRISVYEPRGQLQLIAETLEPRGAGLLQLAFD